MKVILSNINIFYNIILCAISYIPINIFYNTKIVCFMNLVKSFYLPDPRLSYKIHHIISFVLSFFYLYTTYDMNETHLHSLNIANEFVVISRINNPTIFLLLREKYKSIYLDISFFVFYSYYRGYLFYYYYFNGFEYISLLCENDYCEATINNFIMFLCILNFYWYIHILKKVYIKLIN